ncbi:uncharacterized protein LOC113158547 isoform X2 [Anabas testudineus]|uniref:uncharacterized protein LOC113158547 isoform X2 n=1 Tax=Anabas testudineus TaxID=64144 RepID=UPI000E4598C4|nr:uncharacterized protein LOC113158547 isoform X2 [Anabas testudineus]
MDNQELRRQVFSLFTELIRPTKIQRWCGRDGARLPLIQSERESRSDCFQIFPPPHMEKERRGKGNRGCVLPPPPSLPSSCLKAARHGASPHSVFYPRADMTAVELVLVLGLLVSAHCEVRARDPEVEEEEEEVLRGRAGAFPPPQLMRLQPGITETPPLGERDRTGRSSSVSRVTVRQIKESRSCIIYRSFSHYQEETHAAGRFKDVQSR